MQETSPIVTYRALLLVGVTGAAGDILVSRWAETGRWSWLGSSWVCWIISVTLFGVLLRGQRFNFITAIFIAFATHSMVSLAYDRLRLQSSLSRLEWLGIGLAILAVVVIEVGRSQRVRETQPMPVVASVTAPGEIQ